MFGRGQIQTLILQRLRDLSTVAFRSRQKKSYEQGKPERGIGARFETKSINLFSPLRIQCHGNII